MAKDIERIEAGGFEDELRKIIDQVEESREKELGGAIGRTARSEIMKAIKEEVLRRFSKNHPKVKVKFLTGPYRDSNEGMGPARRIR